MSFTYIDKLIQNCGLAKVAKSSKKFILNQEFILDQEFILGNLSQLDGISTAIYIIEEINGNKEATFDNFKKYKDQKERKCAKLNSPSSVLYVGSSTTGVKKRIKQHLGEGYKGTYALHLKKWFNGNCKVTVKIYDEPIEVLQIIEDNLSYQLKPAFGKQGGNNK